MTCKTVQRAINERLPEDPDGLPSDIAGHLAGCPACQSYAACVAGIGSVLAQCRARAAALPESDLLAVRERIAEAVAARHSAPPARCRPAFPASADPLLVWGSGLAALLAAAFIGVLAWPRGHPPHNAGGQPATDPVAFEAEPLSTKLATKIEEPRTPHLEPPSAKLEKPQLTGLPAFLAEYEALKASSEGVTPGFLLRLARYLEGPSRTLDERLQGWKLLCDACEEAGEKKMAVDAFGRHLDAYEEKRVARMALEKPGPILSTPASYAMTKVNRVFYGDKDKFGALAYGDLILTRYPDSKEADSVQMLIGDYYESARNFDTGIQQMQAIIELRPGTPLALQAKENMARMLYNSKRRDEALAVWQELAESEPADKQARSYYQLGVSAHACGPRYYARAMKYLQLAIKHDNEQGWGGAARELLARINAQMMGDPTRI